MKIKLDEVIDALEFINDGIDTNAYYNQETGEIIYLNEYTDSSIDEEYLYDKYLSLPTKYEINEYNMMEEFIETIEDEWLYNELYNSIHGKKAFRRFKDTCINYNIIDDWYKFRDKQYKDIAIEWCKKNKLNFY